MARITIFTSPNCPKCQNIKQLLNTNKIDFDEIDASIDNFINSNNVNLYKIGIMSLPVVLLDDEVLDYDTAIERIRNGIENS